MVGRTAIRLKEQAEYLFQSGGEEDEDEQNSPERYPYVLRI